MYPPTLVLNADYRPLSYFPLSTWGWETTIHHVFKERVDVLAEYKDVLIRSPSTSIKLPSVVALREYQSGKKHVPFTRFNLFLRDGFKCQYCQGRFRAEDLTFDHVKPRAQGGKTTWENIVAACRPCNSLKADRIHMTPVRKPFKPGVHLLQEAGRKFPPRFLHESWNDFLYWDSPLDP